VPGEGFGKVIGAVVQVGFLVVFAVVMLIYSIYFGNELLKTQREGIVSINRILDAEQTQTQQLQEMNQRLDRLGETMTVLAAQERARQQQSQQYQQSASEGQ